MIEDVRDEPLALTQLLLLFHLIQAQAGLTRSEEESGS
jgi:hypothetical protein